MGVCLCIYVGPTLWGVCVRPCLGCFCVDMCGVRIYCCVCGVRRPRPHSAYLMVCAMWDVMISVCMCWCVKQVGAYVDVRVFMYVYRKYFQVCCIECVVFV